jgi:plastocyanin
VFLNEYTMKTITSFNARLITGALLLISVLSLSGCQKAADPLTTDPGTVVTPGANEVFISGSAFTPEIITVAANTTITWTNKDAMTHTVTSNSGVFSSGNMAKNATFSFKFTTPGTYAYHCALHSTMTATVVVN